MATGQIKFACKANMIVDSIICYKFLVTPHKIMHLNHEPVILAFLTGNTILGCDTIASKYSFEQFTKP